MRNLVMKPDVAAYLSFKFLDWYDYEYMILETICAAQAEYCIPVILL
jgi:hypothetical protein